MTARSFPRLENWGLELVVNYLPIVYFNSQDAADLRLIFHWLTQAGGGWADLAAGGDPYLATGSGKITGKVRPSRKNGVYMVYL